MMVTAFIIGFRLQIDVAMSSGARTRYIHPDIAQVTMRPYEFKRWLVP
jgi:hypothetical protein